MQHTGRAVVFEDYNDMAARIDRDDLDVDASSVLVLKNAGPLGGPGFPEWGMLPMPKKLIKQGVKDMVRLSDGRMSGTSYGTCVLHVAPEAYIGGPLALVKNGDLIELDVEKRALNLKISDEEMKKRKAAWKRPPLKYERSYGAIFSRHVKQANEGCDFDFLEGTAPTAEPEIH
jgi:dihydroxy-acid dehydratase